MGKNKNRGNNNNQGNTNNQEQNHEGTPKNSEEQSNEETNNDTANENSNESKNKNNNKQGKDGVIVLGVYLHCQGCVETVVKSLRGFDGVEEIEPNTKDHRVVVKGKTADPIKVADRVRQKSGKHVDLISPVPKKQQEKKQEKKPEQPKVIETVLKIHLHCEGCAKDVKHCIHKMKGVQTVNVDMKTSQVAVKGVFDPKDLVAYVSKRAGKHAEIMNMKNQKKNKNEGGEQKEGQENSNKEKGKDNNHGGGKNSGAAYPNHPPGLVYAPQLFSDENPNACFIM